MPQELVVISGKGGTGKTSLVASFAALAHKAVVADCDVDAADLHLVLQPTILQRTEFSGGKRARITRESCSGCAKCVTICRSHAIQRDPEMANRRSVTFRVDPIACEGCGVCAWFCPAKAIEFAPAVNGEWFISETRFGPMVHAKLGIAEENSGKLVTIVRSQAKALARERKLELVLIDGSPGIGCPVIASITGADLVLIVTEPTMSGEHDLGRAAELAHHFGIPTMVCVNKWDLNPEAAARIENRSREHGLQIAGRVRYDRGVVDAQINRKTVVEHLRNGCADDIRSVWAAVAHTLRCPGEPHAHANA
ncbi:MAG TPA: ATP-binding protein [Planctomycetota bacterium]|nr:ATP-binding protein [Planctomycetota bacterium]